MSDANEAYGLLFATIYAHSPTGLLLRRSGVASSQGEVLYAAALDGRRHLLVPVSADFSFSARQGEALDLTEWHNDSNPQFPPRFMDLVCTNERLGGVFSMLVDDVLERIAVSPSDAPAAVQDSLEDWQRLLQDARSQSLEQARGLFGEVYVLRRLAEINPHYAVACWSGPDRSAHDFQASNGHLEVKTSTSDGLNVVISSLRQLDPLGAPEFALVRLAVQDSPQGQTIDDLVAELVSTGCPEGQLLQRLSAAGHVPGDETAPRFVAIDPMRGWLVGPDFPGLRESEVPEGRRDAISRVSYTLSLANAPGSLAAEDLHALFIRLMTA